MRRLQFENLDKGMILSHLKLRVDSEDQSFMPTQVSVYARESASDKNTLLKDVHIRENTKYNRAVTLLGQQKKYHCLILLKINNNAKISTPLQIGDRAVP